LKAAIGPGTEGRFTFFVSRSKTVVGDWLAGSCEQMVRGFAVYSLQFSAKQTPVGHGLTRMRGLLSAQQLRDALEVPIACDQ
jgi:hypothetical protein